MLTSLVSLQQGIVKKPKKLVKIVNIEGENLYIFWTISKVKVSMNFSGRMWLMMILKVTKSSRPRDQTNLFLKSIKKVKPGFLFSLMFIFPKSNGTKFWSHSFSFQNSSILQTRMKQREDFMKMNFDNFQIQKWT